MAIFDVSEVFLLDFVPRDSHPYIKKVLEQSKKTHGTRVLKAKDLPALNRRYAKIKSFESLNRELDGLLSSNGVEL